MQCPKYKSDAYKVDYQIYFWPFKTVSLTVKKEERDCMDDEMLTKILLSDSYKSNSNDYKYN